MRRGVMIMPATLLLSAGAAIADPGGVRWTFALAMDYPGTPVVTPFPAPGGAVLWHGTRASVGLGNGGLNALAPDGTLLWRWAEGGTNGVVSVAPDGSIYAGDIIAGGHAAITRLTPGGQIVWQHALPGMYELIGGPDVGPDGNIYAVADVSFGDGYMVSVTAEGAWRWQLNGYSLYGAGESHIVFSGGRVFKVEDRTPMPAGPTSTNAGLTAVSEAGALEWHHAFAVGPTAAHRQPVVSPVTGFVHVSDHNHMRTYRPDGTVAWETYVGFRGQGMDAPAAGPDGSVYAVHGNTSVLALNGDGTMRWYRSFVLPTASFAAPVASPDGAAVAVAHVPDANAAPPAPGRVVVFRGSDGATLWSVPLPEQAGGFPYPHGLAYSADGLTLYVSCRSVRPYPQGSSGLAYLMAIETGAGAACYANCDQSTSAPALNVADFSCFLAKFAAGDPSANCDQSTVPPVLNVQDFSCFLNAYAAGCL